jgi:hypothetical protein
MVLKYEVAVMYETIIYLTPVAVNAFSVILTIRNKKYLNESVILNENAMTKKIQDVTE